MAPAAPKITIAKPNGGVVPITQNNANPTNAEPQATVAAAKAPAARLKVLVRRLPPGLTQGEFETVLDAEWKVGAGKVDWMMFRPGKVSQDPSKPSRPARAYLHLTDKAHLSVLADKVRQASFVDARNSANDSVLIGPPALEFAPYSRVPTGRRRNDARQGMIDQDPEFIEFLESLTNPIPKPTTVDSVTDGAGKKEEVVTTTPLIQYLRDKRAAKDKNSAAKSGKHSRQDSKAEGKEAKGSSKAAAKTGKDGAESKKPTRSARIEKVPKEVLKPPKRDTTSTTQKASEPASSPAPPSDVSTSSSKSSGSEKKKPAVSHASAAARMIQRDLGLKGRERPPRRTEKGPTVEPVDPSGPSTDPTVSAEAASSPQTASASPAVLKRTEQKKPPPKGQTPTTTKGAKPQSDPTASSTTPTSTAPPPRAPKPPAQKAAPKTTHAFLKHANASQGITEELIHTALTQFGTVLSVEIDKRKGFAYVDFETTDGLHAAMRASPVKVAQGSVQVLERKDRVAAGSAASAAAATAAAPKGPAAMRGGGGAASAPTGPAPRGGARGRGGRGGGRAAAGAPAAAATTSNSDAAGSSAPAATPAEPVSSAPAATAAAAPAVQNDGGG